VKNFGRNSKIEIMIKEEMLVRKKSIARYRQDSNSGELKDFDEKKNQKRKKQKIILKLLKEVCIVKIVIMKDTLQMNVDY